MSAGVILTGWGLAILADRISSRLDEPIEHQCNCICDFGCETLEGGIDDGLPSATSYAPPSRDARERKWAAEKLLRPISPDNADENFTQEEWLEVCRQTWDLRTGRSFSGSGISAKRFRFLARQLHHTTSFARRIWGLEDEKPVVESEVPYEWSEDEGAVTGLEGNDDPDAIEPTGYNPARLKGTIF